MACAYALSTPKCDLSFALHGLVSMEDCSSKAVTQEEARSSPPCHSLSILKALKGPKASDLTRKRKVDCNPPPKGKRRAHGEGSNEPKQFVLVRGERISR